MCKTLVFIGLDLIPQHSCFLSMPFYLSTGFSTINALRKTQTLRYSLLQLEFYMRKLSYFTENRVCHDLSWMFPQHLIQRKFGSSLAANHLNILLQSSRRPGSSNWVEMVTATLVSTVYFNLCTELIYKCLLLPLHQDKTDKST